MITADDLRQLVSYNPDTGIFTRLKGGKLPQGSPIGTITKSGYLTISIRCKTYRAHRLAWLYVHGEMPSSEIHTDHINGNRSDNRISNIRLCTRSENMRNTKVYKSNTSGFKGVVYLPRSGKWVATIKLNKKLIRLGLFENADSAHKAYVEAATNLFGEFLCVSRTCAKTAKGEQQ